MESDSFDQADAPFEIVTRHMIMERHINPHGHVFGGVLLAWLDECSALYAMEKTGYPEIVTVSMDHVNFVAPSQRGDHVAIHCRLFRVGRSSVCVQAKAVVYDPEACTEREAITCEITYVCLKNGKAFRYFESDEYAAWQERRKKADGASG